MRMSDDRYTRYLRRYELARRMIEHGAHSCTITRWTGLTKYRIQTLANACERRSRFQPRGFAPRRSTFFFRTLMAECESAIFALIALQMDLIPFVVIPPVAVARAGIVRGEWIVTAYDIYHRILPESRLTLDHAILLIDELAHAATLSVATCEQCAGLMVIDRLGRPQSRCPFCRSGHEAYREPVI